MKVVLITSGQPSTNPRLVKEAFALINAGYEVTLIYQFRIAWAERLDFEILNETRLKSIKVGGHPTESRITYLSTTIRHKLAQWLAKLIGIKFTALYAIGRCTPELVNQAKKIKADVYIAHNLAALPAAALAAKKNKAKLGFDAEDFHRHELYDDPQQFDVRLKVHLEDRYLPVLDYLSTASPLISKAYQHLYPNLRPHTILNVFPKENINEIIHDYPIKLFWFSQVIGRDRGLEAVIKAIGNCKQKFELHLLGEHKDGIKDYFNQIALENEVFHPICYYHPISPDQIISFAQKFDIGLATEIGIPKNRDICLTNKIFTYIQSGLAIIASDTTAQKQLIEDYPNMGIIYKKNDSESLTHALKMYLEDKYLLFAHQKQAFKYAGETLNWDSEKEKFLSNVKYTIEN
ncbi:hypothetical protein J7E50_24020 [Pedobacter sp. ISL-68]|uniref:hypothetical protein n=1 Tax=unclassified Pedobacter TaxID=2628915 RepID=UPI001BE58D06|nr:MULTISPECIES: hypothetical protein [unclassified Pedobacter]MBT2562795.1 hypothetical protein [Pedobacter sp. ISL-64]MBT2593308.1 hypothetical protein [Pedobacter sp. ISL-68]